MRTLLVEDDPSTRALLTRQIEAHGHLVVACADAESAWEEYSARPADLVVLDWLLPTMDGLDFCRRVRASAGGDQTVVLVVTVRDSADDLRQVLDAGADDYIAKPYTPEQLHVRLEIAARKAADIRRRRLAEEAMRESESRYRLLAEYSTDIITTQRADGAYTYVSPACRALLGHEPEQLVGRSPLDLIHPDDVTAVRQAHQTVLQSRGLVAISYRFRTLKRGYVWIESTCRVLPKSDGTLQMICVSRDVSSRKQQEEDLRAEQELLKKMIDVHEQERKLIAYEIHDGLVQYLAGALMHFEAFDHVRQTDPELGRQEFDTAVNLLRDAVAEARRLISGIRPPILDERGIVEALEHLINEARRDLETVEFIHDTRFQRLSPPLETAVFRVVQEALTNVCRHSGAAKARVELSEHGGFIRIMVRDWGKGFKSENVREGSFGLQGIRERARLFGGYAEIESVPGKGTRILVEFPLLPTAEQEASPTEE